MCMRECEVKFCYLLFSGGFTHYLLSIRHRYSTRQNEFLEMRSQFLMKSTCVGVTKEKVNVMLRIGCQAYITIRSDGAGLLVV